MSLVFFTAKGVIPKHKNNKTPTKGKSKITKTQQVLVSDVLYLEFNI
jgi:hypothetical protein